MCYIILLPDQNKSTVSTVVSLNMLSSIQFFKCEEPSNIVI